METVLLVVHLLIVVALIGTVLLQRSEGGALGIGGGGGGGGLGGFMTARGAANVLTRTTAILAGAFFITSISLVVLSRPTGSSGSVIDGVAVPQAPAGTTAPSAPDGNAGSLIDRLGGTGVESGTPAPQTPQAPTAPLSQ
jgi:preprotein translocase subunit SecG